uniref:Uncharacterized protein n=1 Tax=Arundo donax TaxID=35708 RepID=A0A0A9GSE7_ARUDO
MEEQLDNYRELYHIIHKRAGEMPSKHKQHQMNQTSATNDATTEVEILPCFLTTNYLQITNIVVKDIKFNYLITSTALET